jgi:hypothetical protein
LREVNRFIILAVGDEAEPEFMHREGPRLVLDDRFSFVGRSSGPDRSDLQMMRGGELAELDRSRSCHQGINRSSRNRHIIKKSKDHQGINRSRSCDQHRQVVKESTDNQGTSRSSRHQWMIKESTDHQSIDRLSSHRQIIKESTDHQGIDRSRSCDQHRQIIHYNQLMRLSGSDAEN